MEVPKVKPGFRIVLVVLICSILVAVLFSTDPVRMAAEQEETVDTIEEAE